MKCPIAAYFVECGGVAYMTRKRRLSRYNTLQTTGCVTRINSTINHDVLHLDLARRRGHHSTLKAFELRSRYNERMYCNVLSEHCDVSGLFVVR